MSKTEELLERGITVDGNGKITNFNPNYFPQYVKNHYKIIYAKDGYYYEYKNNVWIRLDENALLRKFRDLFQAPMYGIWSPRYESDYMVGMKRELYYDGELNPKKQLINLINGMYDTDTFKLLPHSPEYYSVIQIQTMFDEHAECPMFEKFIDQIFEGDKERISVAQEWAGYVLTTHTNAQKALILLGDGSNGKGVFTDVLSRLIGEENISNIPLNELSKSFSRVKLFGRTANISGENEMNGKSLNSQYLKAITGEDTISAEEKGKAVFSFRPTVKLIFTMNSLPVSYDNSYGFYRRLSILAFTATFNGENKDTHLKEKLTNELPGIFLWAMEGLKRLRENDFKFSDCQSMDDILRRYQSEQKPLYEFFEDCIAPADDPENRVGNKMVYETFRRWAVENGIASYYSKMSAQRFWREFEECAKKNGYKCTSGRSNSFRFHRGFKINDAYQASNGISLNNQYNIVVNE